MKSSRKHLKILYLRVRAIALLTQFPALISGCTEEIPDTCSGEPEEIRKEYMFSISKSIDYETVNCLDIFIFNDDAYGRLDSYQRCPIDPEGEYGVTVSSTKGSKRIVMIANSGKGREEWAAINSYEALLQTQASLYEENVAFPTMCGETVFDTGDDFGHIVSLKPFVSEIHLSSIRCDFTGREYQRERLTDVQVYLINVNTGCRLMQEHDFQTLSIANTGDLNRNDLEMFSHPELVFRELDTDIGREIFDTDIRLYCYPNESREETPGTPFTRLVIKGKIGGETWYYPIDINRDSPNGGIGRNCRYAYDLTILRTGSKSPDKPVSDDTIIINCKILPWYERDEEEIIF